jgi:hypothetical protein
VFFLEGRAERRSSWPAERLALRRSDAIRRETGARVETAVADLESLEQVRRMASDVAAGSIGSTCW